MVELRLFLPSRACQNGTSKTKRRRILSQTVFSHNSSVNFCDQLFSQGRADLSVLWNCLSKVYLFFAILFGSGYSDASSFTPASSIIWSCANQHLGLCPHPGESLCFLYIFVPYHSKDHVQTFVLPAARPKVRARHAAQGVRPSSVFKNVVPPPASRSFAGSQGRHTLQWKSLLLGRCPGRASRLGFPVPCPVPAQTPLEEHM